MNVWTFPDPPPEDAIFIASRILSNHHNDTGNNNSNLVHPFPGTALPGFASSSSPGSSNQNQGVQGGGRSTYEFVAFLLWYLFLVVCCVVPTCCAYRRRRRMVATRLAQERENSDQLRQQQSTNVLRLGHLPWGATDCEFDEEAKTERRRRITADLEASTFTVQAKDITDNEEKDSVVTLSNSNKKANHDSGGDGVDNEESGKEVSAPPRTIHVDEEIGIVVLDDDAMDDTLLTLPPRASVMKDSSDDQPSRTVPGGCAICLCPYRQGDTVTWSPQPSCLHAFHKECIIPWLVKKNEPKCPCCRQDFCTIEPILPSTEDDANQGQQQQQQLGEEEVQEQVRQLQLRRQNLQRLSILTPFGLIPAVFAGPVRGSEDSRPAETTTTTNTTVQGVLTDEVQRPEATDASLEGGATREESGIELTSGGEEGNLEATSDDSSSSSSSSGEDD